MLTVRNNACRVDVGPSHGMRNSMERSINFADRRHRWGSGADNRSGGDV